MSGEGSVGPVPDATRRQLLALARQAARCAYCPYSGFHVGAAALASDGRIFLGANIENASYGLTVCAERAAIFSAAAAGAHRLRALAVTCPDAAPGSASEYRMPCGACRQVVAEFAVPGLRVFVDGVADYSLADLLPSAFRLPARAAASLPPARRVLHIDIDNVLCLTDEAMRRLIGEETSGRVRLRYQDIAEFDYRRCKDESGQTLTDEEWRHVHDERFSVAECVGALPPLEQAASELRALGEIFAVAYVTGRKPHLQAASRQWLLDHGFPPGPVLFAGRGEKHLAVQGGFALVEDDREQAEAAALAGVHSVLVAHPWNEAASGSLAHRCADWPAIRQLLLDLAGHQA